MELSRFIVMVGILFVLMSLPAEVPADAESFRLTLFYSGNEQGILEAHGCDEQVGGLDRTHTLLQSLRGEHPNNLNLHVGNIQGVLDTNSELVYQIALEALSLMSYDVVAVGPKDLCLPLETLQTLQANRSDISFVCANLESVKRSTLNVRTFARYVIREIPLDEPLSARVGVVGLISQVYETEVQSNNPSLRLHPPGTTLTSLQQELQPQCGVVVVVLHAPMEEAQELARQHPWVTAFIIPQEEAWNAERQGGEKGKREGGKDHPPGLLTPFSSSPHSALETPHSLHPLLVTCPPQGESVEVLELGLDATRQVVARQHQTVPVSEEITPSSEVTILLDVVERLEEEAWNAEDTSRPLRVGEFEPVTRNTEPATPLVHLVYFYKRGCEKCAHVSKMLQSLREKYPQLVIDKRNVKEHQPLLEAMGQLYGIPEVRRLTTPTVFLGEEYFLDELDETHLEAAIQQHLSTGVVSRLPQAETRMTDASSDIVSRFRSLGVLTVAGAGLLDGINPCAFATLVFFISYLSLVGRSRKEMLLAGLAFASAVFVTYLLLGMGALKFLEAVRSLATVSRYVYLMVGGATLVLALVSFYDAYKAKRGNVKDIKLQLPRWFKLRIHQVIRERTRTSGVIAGALVIGFAISALELVCTGQVYLPTLTFVAGVPGMRLYALWYLLLYNGMFVMPLLVVFGLVYWGATSMQLGGVLQRHLMAVKLGTGMVLFGLGAWLLLGGV